MRFCCFIFAVLTLCGLARGDGEGYFGIHIVDDQTGRGVPLVILQTTNKIQYVTDSSGYVAFFEPGLMSQDVYFGISSWGYEAKDIGFGCRGAVLRTAPGGEAEIRIHRLNIAERLYRLTGEGIYRDSILLGKPAPIAEGLLNGKVMGSDTVETAVYGGKMYWFWGDTDRPSFPLGNFFTTGATSLSPQRLDPDRGIDYTYFVNEDGFARGMLPIHAKESLPVWIDGLMVVNDDAGRAHMVCHWIRANSDLTVAEQGLAEFDDSHQVFQPRVKYPVEAPLGPCGHPMRALSGGKVYYYFAHPFLIERAAADYAHMMDLSTYEGFSCLEPGSDWGDPNMRVNRDGQGRLVWSWQKGAHPIGPEEFAELARKGLVKKSESPFVIEDIASGKPIKPVEITVAWNPFLKKWTMLCGQVGGDSNLGEIWLAYGDAPEGPWSSARKVVTHALPKDNNDFYNPMQHPELMRHGGRFIYFEGTFVNTFSSNPHPTPRYDYNQIMYRIDLADPRLALPEPPPGLTDTKPVQ
jgi:hypothetical protein